jgi:hypothetical protein
MKAKFIFSIAFMLVLCAGSANAQLIVPVQKLELTENNSSVLNQHLRAYTVFSMEKRELINSLYTNGRTEFQIRVDENLNWTFDMQLNDMRAPDFRQTYMTDEGEFEFNEPFVVNTFKGHTTDGLTARLTIDENTFLGIILYDRYHYVIRPTKDFTRNSEDRSFIVYKSSDVIPKDGNLDRIHDVLKAPENDEIETVEQNMSKNTTDYVHCTYYLKIATDADYELFDKMEQNLLKTYDFIFSVLNKVEGVYESTFDMKFRVTYQNVWTSTAANGYPYNTSTDGKALLDNFRNYWNNNVSVSRNIAHLFTGKNSLYYKGESVGGLAWQGHISDSWAYAFTNSSEEIQGSRIATHEIAHNLNAIDTPAGADCCTGQIVEKSVMCYWGVNPENLWFCSQSINEIVSFISKNRHHLIDPIPATRTLSGLSTGFQVYEAGQTITSTQVINSDFTSYKAGEKITLTSGFKVEAGSHFSASIERISDCIGPITIETPPSSLCMGDALQFYVTNATYYTVRVTLLGIPVHTADGSVINNSVTAWVIPAILPIVPYTVSINFYSQHHQVSGTYTVWVNPCL